MRVIKDFGTVIIGSGAAGYNTADCLYNQNVKNIAILSESRFAGTSRNTGSDKQTYYKISLSGNEGDSAYLLAKTLFDGGGMDGDIAMCEAANSIRAFIKLEGLGVKFPQNEYGEFVGYKTDHDPFARASSVGPYTSKEMTEVLEKSVFDKGIASFDNMLCVSVVTHKKRTLGVIAIDCRNLNDDFGLTFFECDNVVAAIGGPAIIYHDSVYPLSHTGFTSLLLRAGAAHSNVSEWQYGLASVDFRWNVSGTYQQVLPRYISIDENGQEREFLNDYYDDPFEALSAVFLKGYQWPFDCKKINGSSKIDLIVHRETSVLKRNVYMDFTREPSCLEGGDFSKLSEECRRYLGQSGAMISKPIERLKVMNKKAIELYLAHGIDITKNPLRVAVCAQHNNGGADVNTDWETEISGLFVAGEAAGTLGIVRPGGTALNSSQVAGIRIADAISMRRREKKTAAYIYAEQEAETLRSLLLQSMGENSTVLAFRESMQKEMSDSFSFKRNIGEMEKSCRIFSEGYQKFGELNKIKNIEEIPELLKNYDMIVTQLCYTESMIYTANNAGSRGGAVAYDSKGNEKVENTAYRSRKITTRFCGEKVEISEREVRPLPEERELWFEKVWNDYLKRRGV